MQLNKETYVRETHKVSLTIDGQEHLLVEGTEACDDFFQKGKTARLINREEGLDLELGWSPGKGREPTVQEKYGRGVRHGQYWLKLEGKLFDELESVPP